MLSGTSLFVTHASSNGNVIVVFEAAERILAVGWRLFPNEEMHQQLG
jgi:predicted ribosome-associated RNA-binding protein Tma20